MSILTLPPAIVSAHVNYALLEDMGNAGDITSTTLLSPSVTASAKIICKSRGIVSGMDLAQDTFRQVGGVEFIALVKDGERIDSNTDMAKVTGDAHSILAGERIALNFLAHLGGIATFTDQFVRLVEGTKAKVCCTRKTIPGLRVLQKYAVRCGGGVNHRFSLSDAILIKDNHIAVAGGVKQAIEKVRNLVGPLTPIEIEVDTLEQLSQALDSCMQGVPHIIMLDNMNPNELKQAVSLTQGKCLLEASGNITLDTIAAVAQTGVDYISTSQITLSAPALDLSLDIEFES